MAKRISREEKLCTGDSKSQLQTLANALVAMQDKIEQQITFFKSMPLSQEVETNIGGTVLKANPEIQEFRAIVRDYTANLSAFQKMVSENTQPTQISEMAELRKKFKIAK